LSLHFYFKLEIGVLTMLSNSQWELTFRWNELGKEIEKHISSQQVTKNKDSIVIGRDSSLCDVVLNDRTVSSVNIEIIFNSQHQKFFVKKLKATNPPFVDNKELSGEELILYQGSIIKLGDLDLKVVSISPDYPSPTIMPSVFSKTGNEPITDNSENRDSSNKEKSLLERLITSALITAVASIIVGSLAAVTSYYTNEMTQKTQRENVQAQLKADKQKLYSERFAKHRDEVIKLSKDKEYSRLKFNNYCSKPINIAVSFYALDEVLQTKGWFSIDPNKKNYYPGYQTAKNQIYLYAKMGELSSKAIWDGKLNEKQLGFIQRYIPGKEFDYIEEPFLEPDVKGDSVNFYNIEFADLGTETARGISYSAINFSCKDSALTITSK
jgi:pSer/pThr/pTyr-binding forkhead associated (FHA) protein